MSEETKVASDETEILSERDWSAAYDAGLRAGREQAWAEAIMILKSAATAAYISGGDTREARELREICLQMLNAAHPDDAGRGRAG